MTTKIVFFSPPEAEMVNFSTEWMEQGFAHVHHCKEDILVIFVFFLGCKRIILDHFLYVLHLQVFIDHLLNCPVIFLVYTMQESFPKLENSPKIHRDSDLQCEKSHGSRRMCTLIIILIHVRI